MTGEGVVIRTSAQTAIVQIERKSACSGDCSSCGMCSNPVFDVEAENKIGAVAGDRVKLFMPTKKVYLSAFLVYMLPVLSILAVLGICSLLSVNPYVTALVALLAIAIWICIIRKYSKSADLKSVIVDFCD